MADPSQCKSAFLTCDWFCNSEKQTLQAPGFSGFGICLQFGEIRPSGRIVLLHR